MELGKLENLSRTRKSEKVIYSLDGTFHGYGIEIDPGRYSFDVLQSMAVNGKTREYSSSVKVYTSFYNRAGKKLESEITLKVMGRGNWYPGPRQPVNVTEGNGFLEKDGKIIKIGEVQKIYYVPSDKFQSVMTLEMVEAISPVWLVLYRNMEKK